MSDQPTLLGREDVLERCRAQLDAGAGVLLYGPAGIGKSAVVEVLGAEAAAQGQLVLRSTPSAVEAGLPHLTLCDLFSGVLDVDPPALPGHLRAALETALLRGAPLAGAATDQLAIRLGVLELLRGLALRGTVLLVLDDAHWIDPASAEVLAFAARRLGGLPVRMLVTERVEPGAEPLAIELLPPQVTEIALDGLPETLLGELLRNRLDMPLTGDTLGRVRASSGGNPLYALELGRALRRRGEPVRPDEPLPVPDRLRPLLSARLAELPVAAMPALLLVAAAARPGRELLPTDDPGLAVGLATGVLGLSPGGELRFSHPLLGELVYADATPAQRQAAHTRLADLVPDPVERVRHRALATPGPDRALAEALEAAAEVALARGAPGTAAELCRLAAEHTPGVVDEEPAGAPADGPALVSHRLLAAARHAHAAGLPDQVRSACLAVIRGPDPADRVGARLLHARLPGQDPADVKALLDAAALDAGGDPRLTGWVLLARAYQAFHETGVRAGPPGLDRIEELARDAGDEELEVEAIATRLAHQLHRDPQGSLAVLERGCALAAGQPLTEASIFMRQIQAVALVRSGDVPGALGAHERLRADTERAGRTLDLCDLLFTATGLYERAGRCSEAHATGQYGGRLRAELESDRLGELLQRGAAELNGGTAERAFELLDAAASAWARTDAVEWLAYALGLRGRAEWLLGRYEASARSQRRSRSLLHRQGYTDPAMFLIDADLAESLILTGATAEAAGLLGEARAEAARLGRDVVTLGLTRSRILLAGVTGDPRAAADELRALLPGDHPYPLEVARALLTLAALERRARRRAAARAALQEAAERYTLAGCVPYLRHAEAELARLDAPEGPLSDLELRIAELVRAGATNREIAGVLHLSVKAVEANLTRLFRRLGVRNRAELISRAPAG
ncbi:transcriptional regulator [Longispora fulva]|uniref:DNA-binding CsgD family transcriptional regulator n=1 Tax=Longispora fulva TaxID=619741 RepID=A0A8J7KPW3_9ACTN|nr:LuxR family transcriptional regulator [Longispora fulva]MBG6141756.1 DNA-binding CsgD family transcriptional regulator [Longispora fulva]GIG59088.1 transcriptional regulator [Longispora fulva]